MLETNGTVVEVEREFIWVETRPRSACSSCGAGSCSTSVIAGLFGSRRNRLRLRNGLGARVGQQVVVGIPDSVLVNASVLAYLLPPLAMILGGAIAAAASLVELAQGGMAFGGLLLGLLLVRQISSSEQARSRYAPRLVRVGGSAEVKWN
jgi:sigma-E factor negative regulatory protein RseC